MIFALASFALFFFISLISLIFLIFLVSRTIYFFFYFFLINTHTGIFAENDVIGVSSYRSSRSKMS